jgi:hypothetical protein
MTRRLAALAFAGVALVGVTGHAQAAPQFCAGFPCTVVLGTLCSVGGPCLA